MIIIMIENQQIALKWVAAYWADVQIEETPMLFKFNHGFLWFTLISSFFFFLSFSPFYLRFEKSLLFLENIEHHFKFNQ